MGPVLSGSLLVRDAGTRIWEVFGEVPNTSIKAERLIEQSESEERADATSWNAF